MIGIGTIVGEVVGMGRDYLQDKRLEKAEKRQHAADIEKAKTTAQIKRIESGDNNAADLDRLSFEYRGWKDEYLLILATLPLIMAFIPGMHPYLASGFHILKQHLPEWYLWLLLAVFVDTFGFRRMLRGGLEIALKKRLSKIE